MQNSKNIDELNELVAKQQFDNITDEDWETLLAALSEKCDWEQMWQLVQIAPATWSLRLLLRLKGVVWKPEQASERAAITQVIQLVEECAQIKTDILGGEPVHCQTMPEGHSSPVTCVAINPDGRILASASWDWSGTVQLWSLSDGKSLKTLTGHTTRVTCLAMSFDGQILASGDCGGTVQLWSLPNGEALQSLYGDYDCVTKRETSIRKSVLGYTCITCLAISPDGRILAIGEDLQDRGWADDIVVFGSRLQLWHPGGEVITLREYDYGKYGGTSNNVSCLAISPDGRVLAGGIHDNSVHVVQLWSLPDEEALQTLERYSFIESMAFNPDGSVLFSGDCYGTVRLTSFPDGKTLEVLEGCTGVTYSVISPDGKILACGSRDNIIRLWSLPDGTLLQTLKGHTDAVTCLAISNGGRVLASGSRDGTVRLWALWKIRLKQLISEPTSPEHVKWVEDTLKKEKVTDTERKWLECLLALMRWQVRET